MAPVVDKPRAARRFVDAAHPQHGVCAPSRWASWGVRGIDRACAIEHHRMPGSPTQDDEKVCRVCGRRFAWRKKWERDWDRVRHCSSTCRRRGITDLDERLERALAALLDERTSGATVCPSEAARVVAPNDWRPLMEPARMAARRLVERGLAQITQKGRVVDPSTARGPIRVGRARGVPGSSVRRGRSS
jgi:hypothetical protein